MNRRAFLKTLGAVGAIAVLPINWVAEQVPDYSFFQQRIWMPGGPLRIAAANASITSKAAAHLVATGHDDQEMMAYAFELMDDGGTILLSEGDYYMPDGIAAPVVDRHWSIVGSGVNLTFIQGHRCLR